MRTFLYRAASSCCAMVAAACVLAAAEPAAAPVKSTHISVLTGDQVIQILDETVDWYRTLGAQEQSATQPSDLLILYANQQTADKVIGLAFELARANAELLSSEADTAGAVDSPQSLSEQQKRLDAQRKGIQDEMAEGKKSGKPDMQEKLSELQGELDMVNARKNLLDTMAQFVNQSDAKRASAAALKAHIDAIAVSIPAARAPGSAAPAAQSAPAPTLSSPSDRIGIWELGTNVLRLGKKMRTIDTIDERTADLEKTFVQIRTKPLEQLHVDNTVGALLF